MDSLSRRLFFSGAAGALWMPSAMAEAVKLPRPVRLALIGGKGHVGEILGPLPKLPDVTLVAWWEADAKDRQSLLKNPLVQKAKEYSDYRQMLDEEKPDVVAICTSNGERWEHIVAAAERGIPFIAEKPFATEWSTFHEVDDALKAHPKVRFSTLLPMRFEPEYLALRRVVEEGLIGEVAQISAQKSYKPGNRPHWMRDRKTYGGTIPWIGIHMVDLMRWSSDREFREAVSFQNQIGEFPGIGDMENVTATLFKLDNGGVGMLRMDYFRPETAPTHGDDRLRLAGMKGVVEYQAATGVTVLSEGKPPQILKDLPPGGSVFVDFLESAFKGKPPALKEADILRTNQIVLAARESAERHKIINL